MSGSLLALGLGNSLLWSLYLLLTRHVVSGAALDAWAYTLVQLLAAGLVMLWLGRRARSRRQPTFIHERGAGQPDAPYRLGLRGDELAGLGTDQPADRPRAHRKGHPWPLTHFAADDRGRSALTGASRGRQGRLGR